MRWLGLLLLLSLGCSAIDNFGSFHPGDGAAAGDGAADLTTAPSDLAGPATDGAVADLIMGPTAKINHLGNGQTRTVGIAIPFVGVATDPRDGALTGNSLVWTDNLEGQIGTGEMFSATLYKAGMHTVTLTATDSLGLKGTDSIMLILIVPDMS